MAGRWELTDEQWELVEPILRPARRENNRGRLWDDTRTVLNGVLWILGSGAQWSEMPPKYPPYQTCHRRFQQWIRDGSWLRRCACWPAIFMSEASCIWMKRSWMQLSQAPKRGPRGRPD